MLTTYIIPEPRTQNANIIYKINFCYFIAAPGDGAFIMHGIVVQGHHDDVVVIPFIQ